MVENKSLVRKLAFACAVFAVILFCLFPFMQMLSISLKHQWDWGNQSLIPRSINLNAYKELLNIGTSLKELPESVRHLLEDNPDLTAAQKTAIIRKFQSSEDVFPFVKYFRNSLLVSTLSSFASVVLAVLGAYSFSRTRYRERALVQRGVLFVYMFGGTLLLIPMYKLAVSLGFMASPGGSMTALGIVYLVQTLPVSLYMLGNYFRTIPYSIEEAALIDGCNRWQTIYRIILPLSISAIATVFIYSFMIAWNEYLFASVFLKSYKDSYTLTIGLKSLFVSKNAIWDRIMAASMLTAIPVIALFMMIQQRLVTGLAQGGVKE